MTLYTIYENLPDYPKKYVVRRWEIEDGPKHKSKPIAVVPSLTKARAKVPKGLDNLGHFEDDPPEIVEYWL